MLRYLQQAFLVKQRIPLLGAVPINFLLLAATAVLGLAHPAFWLLGLGAEVALLWALVGNRRFRNLVDAEALQSTQAATDDAHEALETQLEPPAQQQLTTLRATLNRIEADYDKFAPSDPTAQENLRNLQELEGCYLKLLLARQHLDSNAQPEAILQQLAELEQALAAPKLPPALRASKEATRSLLQRRLTALEQRSATRAEIESDLTRIEAQVHLAADAAAVHAKPASLTFDLDFASRMITHPELYGGPPSTEAFESEK